MSVNIDTVYQRVLGILNKEQRGYVTPQEFNLFANQAQMDLFEQYFYDINQFGRIPGNSTAFSDMLTILNEKIALFQKRADLTYDVTNNIFPLPTDLYRLGTIIYQNSTTDPFNSSTPITEDIEAERINANELLYINSSPLTKPVNTRPIYTQNELGIRVFGAAEITDAVSCSFIKKPTKVEWKYQIVYGEALYDASQSINFELHPSEETELVIKILEMAGLLVKDIQMYQIAAGEEVRNTQEEKA